MDYYHNVHRNVNGYLMTVKEMVAVMQRYDMGKCVVEFKEIDQNDEDYIIVRNPSWDWSMYDYRIKVKQEQEHLYHGYITKLSSGYAKITNNLIKELATDKKYMVKIYEATK